MEGSNMPSQSSKDFEYCSDSKYVRTQNMARMWIWEGHTGWWICLNKPEYALTMPQYSWICLDNAEYAWIYLNIPE